MLLFCLILRLPPLSKLTKTRLPYTMLCRSHGSAVTALEGSDDVLDAVFQEHGDLHVLVNTAGGVVAQRTLSKDGPHPLDAFRKVIDLNLIATFNLSRLAAAHMAKNEPDDDERGVIINTASIAAFAGQIGQVA